MRKSYAIGNPISNPYFDAIFGINNRGRLLGSTVYRTIRVSISPSEFNGRLKPGFESGIEGDTYVSLRKMSCNLRRTE